VNTPQRNLAARIANGVSVDVVVRARSAPPINVSSRLAGSFRTGGPRIRPDLVPNVPVFIDDPTAPGGRLINPDAFVPRNTTHGNMSRNSLRGFGASQIDVALGRYVPVGGGLRMQVRLEVYNLFNQANFAQPIADLDDGQFGRSTEMLSRSLGGLNPLYQIGGPRSIQLGLKAVF
jgi:hypothetical protein